MSIKQTRYVDIASAVIGASAVPMRKLTARVFSTNPKIPAGKVLEFASGQVDDLLGTDSPEAHFARQYFSYVSPAPASKPKELQIASYEPVGRAPTLFGEKTGDLADLKLINEGELNITIGKVTKTITGIDLSESTSYADVATAVQAKLNAESEPQFASAYVTFNSLDSAFVISGGVQERADISVRQSVLADAMNISHGTSSAGNPAQTPLQAFIASEAVSDSFGSATFLTELSLEHAVELAQYVAGENVKYQLHLSVTNKNAEDFSGALVGTASI
ncbi:TPA: DUF3383 family protein, partial [Proteus mirabilis]|nr:DUF3383 family protein [Proteus mirabilis]